MAAFIGAGIVSVAPWDGLTAFDSLTFVDVGNMMAKQLVFLSQADTGGIVLGARVPVMLTSRADDEHARLISAALAVLYGHWRRTGVSHVKELAP